MKVADADILILPGMGGGNEQYWYERWCSKLRTARRIEQSDWDHPIKEKWCETVVEAVSAAERPVVLIGHSLGVITIAHVAPLLPEGKVIGAYLVAPPDTPNVLDELPEIENFCPVPTAPLPFPSILVASTNDPYCSVEAAQDMSIAWGSKFENAGESGHINADSGQGPWPEGLLSFAHFMAILKPN